MTPKCETCIYFKKLIVNYNFGKCTFPNVVKIELLDMEALMTGLGFANNTPIIHKDSTYDCHVSE